MNKLNTYKQLRKQLASEYEAEMSAVQDIVENGIFAISGARNTLNTTKLDSLSSLGEARRIMREDVQNALRIVLDRYRDNLKVEVTQLGLYIADTTSSSSLPPAQGSSLANYARGLDQSHDTDWSVTRDPMDRGAALPSEDSPAVNMRNAFPENAPRAPSVNGLVESHLDSTFRDQPMDLPNLIVKANGNPN